MLFHPLPEILSFQTPKLDHFAFGRQFFFTLRQGTALGENQNDIQRRRRQILV
jgi:hypothetical protein